MTSQDEARQLGVLVVDDNPVVRLGLVALFRTIPQVVDVWEAGDGIQAVDVARQHRPDLVLLDVRMPRRDGLSALPGLVPIAPVVMLTACEDIDVVRTALERGACGYLIHSQIEVEHLRAALRVCVDGGAVLGPGVAEVLTRPAAPRPPQTGADRSAHLLTAREREVMDGIAQGLSNAEIARHFRVREKTVKNHVNRIYAKLGYVSRAQAVRDWLT